MTPTTTSSNHEIMKYYLKPLENPPRWSDEIKKVIAWSLCWEGTITLTFRKGHIKPRISISNTDRSLLLEFQKLLDLGYVTVHHKTRRGVAWRTLWHWRVETWFEVLFLLSEIIDFLPAKKEQAQIVIDFINHRIERGSMNSVGVSIPIDEYERNLVERIRMLNRRGKN